MKVCLETQGNRVSCIKSFGFLGAVVAFLAGCEDSTGLDLNPVLVSDTVTVAAPLPQTAGLPTALDVTSDGAFGINGGRFPELIRDALQWDFAVRIQSGQLVLVPAQGIGVTGSRAALTPPIAGAVFEDLREAPGQRTFSVDSAIAMVEGAVYVARSREATGSFGSACVQFAKMQALDVNVAAGTVHFRVVTNERCGDPRLVSVD
jgi:hypothetical protein